MRFYSVRETSHPGVFAVWQTDQSGESREVEAHIVRVELQGGTGLHYIKAGRVAIALSLPRFLLPRPLPSLAEALKRVEAMVNAGTVGIHEEGGRDRA